MTPSANTLAETKALVTGASKDSCMRFSFKRFRYLFVVSIAVLAGPLVYGQGSIHGRVVDLQGRAIAQALVSAESFDGLSAVAVQEVPTDVNGEFRIANLFAGRYHVIARKEEEGYACNRSDLYNLRASPLVELTETNNEASVSVVLGPKAALLSRTIVEDATGEPAPASVVLWRMKEPGKPIGMAVGPDFHLLVPSGTDVGVKFISNGHEDWIIDGGSVHMGPQDAKSITVRLRRVFLRSAEKGIFGPGI